jgi:hypothetical protein
MYFSIMPMNFQMFKLQDRKDDAQKMLENQLLERLNLTGLHPRLYQTTLGLVRDKPKEF